jgi:hypothetical protein
VLQQWYQAAASVALTCGCLPCTPFRLAITPSGSLAITDATNTTQWTTQTSCLPAAPANVSFCLHEYTGNLTLEGGTRGLAMWSSQPQPCQGSLRQLHSSSRSELQCVKAPQQVLSSQDCSQQLAVGSGPLKLSAAGSSAIWSSPALAQDLRGPTGLCLQLNGSLVYSSAGGAVRLWSSAGTRTGSSFNGPYVAQIRDSALQVGCGKLSCQNVACVSFA